MNILSIIFKTSSCNSTPIPEKNKYILGISSLWILLLFNNSLLLSLNIILLSIISPIFWYKYEINSIYHKLDKLLVWTMILLNIKNALIKLYISTSIILFSLIIFFYYLSEIFIIKRKFKYQILSHLLFRYFFFIWIYLTIFNNLYNIPYITFGYIFHNYYLYLRIYKYDLYNYLYYLYQLLFFISLYLKNVYHIL